MEEQNIVPFPYDFKEISDEEKDLLKKLYEAPNVNNFVRVGPKGFIVTENYRKIAADIYNMPLRPSDVFVASFPRSGTTWTQELVWLLANDLDYSAAAVKLGIRYISLKAIMHFDKEEENSYVNGHAQKDNVGCSSYSAAGLCSITALREDSCADDLTPKILQTAKVVYVARDPRDVVVSCYHLTRLFTYMGYTGTFKDIWNLFHNSLYGVAPYFEHVKEAWDKRHHPNMLFLFYEELSKDLPSVIRRVADFLGKQLNEEQMAGLCEHLSIENFRNNKSVNFEELREFGMLAENEKFVRKGKVGGWHDYFDEEMTQQADQWIKDNLRDTDLRFPHTDLI